MTRIKLIQSRTENRVCAGGRRIAAPAAAIARPSRTIFACGINPQLTREETVSHLELTLETSLGACVTHMLTQVLLYRS